MRLFRSDQIALLVLAQRAAGDSPWRANTMDGLFRSLAMTYALRCFAERDYERYVLTTEDSE